MRSPMVASTGSVVEITKEASSAAGRSKPVGQSGQQAMDGPDRQLVVGQLDHQGHDEIRRARALRALFPSFGLVGERRLETMMAVGDDHRGGGDRVRNGLDRRRIGDRPQLVDDAVGIGRLVRPIPARSRSPPRGPTPGSGPRSARGWWPSRSGVAGGRSWPSGWCARGEGCRRIPAFRGRGRRSPRGCAGCGRSRR